MFIRNVGVLSRLAYCMNLGPSPALARDAQALARPVSDSLSELPARVRPDPSFFSPSPKTAYTTVSAIKILQFCMKWQSDCISFRYFIKLI